MAVEVNTPADGVHLYHRLGVGILGEGGLAADAGHAGQPLAVDEQAGGVDALGRQQLVVQVQVGRGVAQAPAARVPADHGAVKRKRPAEQVFGLLQVAAFDGLADGRAADGAAGYPHRRQALHVPAHRRAQAPAQFHVPLPAPAETGVEPEHQEPRGQQVLEDAPGEFLRRHLGHLGGELHHHARVHAQRAEKVQAVVQRGDGRRGPVGQQDAGMAVEGNDGGPAVAVVGRLHHAPDQLHVAAVHAVEDAERYDGAPAERCVLRGPADDAHGGLTPDPSTRSPQRPRASSPAARPSTPAPRASASGWCRACASWRPSWRSRPQRPACAGRPG